MPEAPKSSPPGVDRAASVIRFDFIKSNYFRVIPVHGVFGGIGPTAGKLQMNVWNERWPIPKQVTHGLGKDGRLLDEILSERVTRDAIVREVEAELEMDLGVAKTLRDWLSEKIDEVERQKAAGNQRGTPT